MNININISKKRIRMGDILDAQTGDVGAGMRLVASCMIDRAGEYINRDEAMAQLRELDAETFETEVMAKFMEALEGEQKKAVPFGAK
jgi:hypothetical protein